MSYIIEGDALHGFVLFQGVHLVQVAVSDEHSPILRLVETVDLINTKLLISHPAGEVHTHIQTLRREVEPTRRSWVYLCVMTDTCCDERACTCRCNKCSKCLLPCAHCRRTALAWICLFAAARWKPVWMMPRYQGCPASVGTKKRTGIYEVYIIMLYTFSLGWAINQIHQFNGPSYVFSHCRLQFKHFLKVHQFGESVFSLSYCELNEKTDTLMPVQ